MAGARLAASDSGVQVRNIVVRPEFVRIVYLKPDHGTNDDSELPLS